MPCTTVSVADPTPDSSTFGVADINAANAPAGEYSVVVTYANTIESGSGEPLTRTVRVTVDGSEVAQETVSTSPGETGTFRVEGTAEPGDRRVCAEVV